MLEPDDAADAIRTSAAALDAWYAGGRSGLRPPGRLRVHSAPLLPPWQRVLATPAYRLLVDPDGRPPWMKVRRLPTG